MTKHNLPLWFFAAILLPLLACEVIDSTPAPVSRPPIVLDVEPSVTPSPTTEETIAPAPTPDDVQETVRALNRALQSGDSAQISPFLLDIVWVAGEENPGAGETLDRQAGLQWIKQHWAATITLSSAEFVRDSALLEVGSSGWAKVKPLEQGDLILHLHRYNANGHPDDIEGSWKIDSLLYK